MSVPALKDLLDFNGKTVVVTGGGSGIGAGIALRFAEAGAAVVANYRSSEVGAEAVVQAIKSRGGKAAAVQADVTKKKHVEKLVAETLKAFSRIDVLVNNAGLYPLASVLEMSEEDWNTVLDSNLRSVFLCTQAAAQQMKKQGGGAIVNIASIEAQNPARNHSHYHAAKAGVVAYTRAAALELGREGIRVNAVSPGLIWREGIEQAWPDGVNRYLKAAPLGRLGRDDDVADACLFLASPAARWITGAELVVDGGVLTNTAY